MVYHRIMTPSVPQNELQSTPKPVGGVKMTLSNEQLTDALNALLNRQSGKVHYRVRLTNEHLQLIGETTVMGRQMTFTVTTVPRATHQGDLELAVQQIKAGKLSIPRGLTMEFLKNNVRLPECMVIRPQKHQVIINLSQLTAKQNITIQVTHVDLQTGQSEIQVGLG